MTDIETFQNLAPESRTVLARGLRYFEYQKGSLVLEKGRRVSGAYVVASGQLRVFTISPDGNEATLYLINPGETCVLALNCIFNDLLYPAWVEAGATTRIAVIPGTEFRMLFEREPKIRNMTVQAFSTIVFRLMAELEDVHSSKLDQRLARFLLLHASTDGKVQMTQQEIASHLGTTREVIARSLRQLASAGHIQTGRNRIVINDPRKLAESVGGR
ncbi:MAG: Crp/Fnr family transcriptional regulator [Gammaproteobacteria bacterium]|nr:Crp/Fnr family transcriptional regulator [Gammaproteobacteria bacterium]